jgi:hypothetical protein
MLQAFEAAHTDSDSRAKHVNRLEAKTLQGCRTCARSHTGAQAVRAGAMQLRHGVGGWNSQASTCGAPNTQPPQTCSLHYERARRPRVARHTSTD